MSIIEIIVIMNYVGVGKRPFVEDTEILKFNHICSSIGHKRKCGK